MSLFRDDLKALPAYVPGKRGADPSVIKLSSNEMPFGPLPSITAVIAEGLETLNTYPDMYGRVLSEKLGELHGVSPDSIVPSNGSVAMIETILNAACTPGSEVIIPWRSFEAYPIAVAVAGADTVRVPLRADGGHDLKAMADAVNESTAAVMVCSPNNPTGHALTHRELAEFLINIPSDVLVVLDEAYIHFVRMEDPIRSTELLDKHPNLIILRTFAKAYSLAGLRVGYAIANPDQAQTLRAVSTPFGVNSLAQAAAAAALDEEEEIRNRTDFIVAERDWVLKELAKLGFQVPRSQGNFVWFAMEQTARFVEVAAGNGIAVRAFEGDGVRVSLGSTEANDRIIKTVRAYAGT